MEKYKKPRGKVALDTRQWRLVEDAGKKVEEKHIVRYGRESGPIST